MELSIFNTKSRQKELFKPIKENEVSLYVCGMTVYDRAHLGHARAYTAFDIIYRFLQYLGFKVTYVRNITDIDDKIINRAQEEIVNYSFNPGLACKQLCEKYIHAFHQDMAALNLLEPSFEPKATEHIEEIIVIIEKLIEKNCAYQKDGSVYFRVSNFKNYGCLSGRDISKMDTQSRIEDDNKEHSMDFALWKKQLPGEPYWESPFGNGRPGWHIECSAMSMKYLGESFDIHGGGQDLIFPHHENEIAQSEASSEKPFVSTWIHNGFITIEREKMSKSLKNFKTINELLMHYHPMHIKFYLISTHYRSPLDFNDKLILSAREGFQKIENALSLAKAFIEKNQIMIENGKPSPEFIDSMCDDFNTPKALGVIFQELSELNIELCNSNADKRRISSLYSSIQMMLDILGVKIELEVIHEVSRSKWCEGSTGIFALLKEKPKKLSIDQINKLVAIRGNAKIQKNFDLADKIRKYLSAFQIELRDELDKTCWKFN